MIVDGWVDWAARVHGHPAKKYSEPNSGEWITCHSVVGDLPGHAIPARFMSDEREPGNPNRFTAHAQASTMFILYKDGHLIQQYPVTASTWTSGGREANTRSWAIEAEGGLASNPGEPLTPAAEATFVRLCREWEAHTGRTARPGLTLLQHKDVAAEFGYAPTACASDRYAHAWSLLEETEMAEAEQLELEALRKRRELAALAADLNRYAEMLDVFDYAEGKGYLR